MINTAYITPHPPIVIPEVGQGEEEKIKETLDSYKKMAKEVKEIKPDTIIITSPHQVAFRDGFYVANAEIAYGDLYSFGANVSLEKKCDKELASLIAENASNISALDEECANIDHGSLVPLYFIEREYTDYEIVLIGLSGLSAKGHLNLGKKIRQAVEASGRKAIMIASGDLSHCLKDYGPYGYKEEGEIFDEKILDLLGNADFDGLINFDEALIDAADQCGIKSFQIMAGVFDGYRVKSEKYSYENTFGVGYGFFKISSDEEIPVDDEYIKLAKKTIEEYVRTGKKIPQSSAPDEISERKGACFVSIHQDGLLRGCIGTISPYYDNLADEIIHNAISACSADPRFPPVSEDELRSLEISVDVLSEMEAIDGPEDLDPSHYGILVSSKNDYRRGLLLPDLDGVDTIDQQMDIAFSKAGMTRTEDYELFRFEVERHE